MNWSTLIGKQLCEIQVFIHRPCVLGSMLYINVSVHTFVCAFENTLSHCQKLSINNNATNNHNIKQIVRRNVTLYVQLNQIVGFIQVWDYHVMQLPEILTTVLSAKAGYVSRISFVDATNSRINFLWVVYVLAMCFMRTVWRGLALAYSSFMILMCCSVLASSSPIVGVSPTAD